ncbi:MAG: D-tyrosyl-tRNA(Tyr) deacylase [Blastocatellia bacterium]
MRAVVQRVSTAQVRVNAETIGCIGRGLLVFLGISATDTETVAARMLAKIVEMRIFADENGAMNCGLIESGGEMLVVSQFTLYADCRRGRRPSFTAAAPPDLAEKIYNYFVESARERLGRIATGQFRAMMDVESINDGPVTIILDSEELFGV